jgi:hypothetical protein
MGCRRKRASTKIKSELKKSNFHYIPFFQSSQRIQAFVFFLASNVEVKHYISNCNSWFTKIYVPLVEVSDNGFFKFTASPSGVPD